MTIYWILLLMPAIFALHPVRVDAHTQKLIFILFGVLLILLVGLRHDVGGDWDRYISIYAFHENTNLDFSKFTSGDYGYEFIHWLGINYFNGVYFTNLISAIFFTSGLIRLSRAMPMPWVSIFVSIQFLVIIVAMGYTRQSVAVGFLLWALVDLMKGNSGRFYLYIAIGTLFHKTLLLMFVIGVMYSSRKKYRLVYLVFIVMILLFIVYYYFLEDFNHLIYYYFIIEFHESHGAIVRSFMGFVAGSLFFIYRKKFKDIFFDEKLWLIFSVACISLLPLAFYFSTIADRIGVYFVPLQLVIFSRIPVLIETAYYRTLFVVGIMLSYSFLIYIWLFFGVNSRHWLPYQNILTLN